MTRRRRMRPLLLLFFSGRGSVLDFGYIIFGSLFLSLTLTKDFNLYTQLPKSYKQCTTGIELVYPYNCSSVGEIQR